MTHSTIRSLASASALALLAASFSSAHAGPGHEQDATSAIGEPGTAAQATRTVKVAMSDNMRFTPAKFTAKQGETVRFVIHNAGQLKHEFVLGTRKALLAHYEEMKKNPEMEHADPNMVTVAPGQTGEVIWRFTKAGTVAIGCLQPGHYDAGMKGAVKVAASRQAGEMAPKAPMSQASLTTTPANSMSQGAAMPTGRQATSGGSTKTGTVDSASMASVMTDGVVKKVDKDTKKITIKHGEIANLQMPGMTMVFQVRDAALLDKVKAGDQVKFRAEKQEGAIFVTDVQTAP